MLAASIKDNTKIMSTAKSRKRARSTSPIQSAGLLGKKPRIAEDFDADMPISQASGETEASSRSVEELAAAGNHAVVHRLAGMFFAFICLREMC